MDSLVPNGCKIINNKQMQMSLCDIKLEDMDWKMFLKEVV
jgi:hypothetical protein